MRPGSTALLLSRLDLSSNQLTGRIPDFLTELPLGSLDLSSNIFTGPIPTGLGLMPQLFWLRMDSNRLNGTIPTRFPPLSCIVSMRGA